MVLLTLTGFDRTDAERTLLRAKGEVEVTPFAKQRLVIQLNEIYEWFNPRDLPRRSAFRGNETSIA